MANTTNVICSSYVCCNKSRTPLLKSKVICGNSLIMLVMTINQWLVEIAVLLGSVKQLTLTINSTLNNLNKYSMMKNKMIMMTIIDDNSGSESDYDEGDMEDEEELDNDHGGYQF